MRLMVFAVLSEDVTSWLVLLTLVLGPGIVATVLWSSVLASSRLRSLFRQLPLTDSMVGNYVLTAMGLSFPWLVGWGWAFSEIGSRAEAGATGGEPLFTSAILLSVVYLSGLPLAAGLGLPRLGIDWDATDYGLGTWLILLVSGAWYVAIFAVPTFVLGIVAALPF